MRHLSFRAFPLTVALLLVNTHALAQAQPVSPLPALPSTPEPAPPATHPTPLPSVAIEPALPELPPSPLVPTPSATRPPPASPATPPSSSSSVPVVIVAAPPASITPRGLSFGLRVGVGFPTGNASPNYDLSESFDYMVPFQFDLGYRLSPHWTLGGYVALAYLDYSLCDPGGVGDSCNAIDIRFGIHAEYNFLPGHKFEPWVGAGIGWEIVNEVETGPDAEQSSNNGPDAHIDLGLDWRPLPTWAMGPYFSTTMGTYGNGPTVHDWVIVGLRAHWDSPALSGATSQ